MVNHIIISWLLSFDLIITAGQECSVVVVNMFGWWIRSFTRKSGSIPGQGCKYFVSDMGCIHTIGNCEVDSANEPPNRDVIK